MTSKRISERELIIPALFCIENEGVISTTELSMQLRTLLKPQGEDLDILSGRNDDKFSQKVRNLRSHKTLDGLADYDNGNWTITKQGKIVLEENSHLLEYLVKQGFDYTSQQETLSKVAINNEHEPINLFDEKYEEIPIVEGKSITANRKVYERSRKLRELAINYFSNGGQIVCRACGFDFYKTYGDHGKGYIEIHHLTPVYSYGSENIEKTLNDALSNLVPLCSNCHSMIHRVRNRMLTIEELIKLLDAAKA